MTTIQQVLAERFDRALAKVYGPELAGADPLLRRSDHADFQSNIALSLKKRTGDNPRDGAAKIAQALDSADLCDRVEVSGPGFINLHLKASFVADVVGQLGADPRLGVALAARPETVVIDYSSPNIAKELHAGHLRSTVIGDALARTLEAVGHRVVRQNHLGDWGTPFGMLIEHLLDLGEGVGDKGVADLNEFYRAAREKFDGSPDFAERARRRVVLLQGGDAPTLELWQRLVDESKRTFRAVYDRLGITMRDGDAAGESLFNSRLEPTVRELTDKGLAVESEGAICVFPPGFKGKEGKPVPLIIRKQDGGYGYATTDLAAIRYRLHDLGATRVIYVVGAPQAQHLTMVYKTAELAGWLVPPARAEHVAFGSVLGEDGKMLKSRTGESVKLMELLQEGDDRALALVREKNAERGEGDEPLSEGELAAAAHAVAIAAIKYADLSADRVKDYVFSWARMLATIGNTGPYLQYAHARNRSILRKAAAQGLSLEAAHITVEAPEERALALALLSFGGAVHDVVASLEPHRLCTYLYDLASTYSTFYAKCPVLKAEPAARASRLALVALTARVLAQGLGLLGIEAPERM
ncbi:MAG: arginine--tRNA ligase [Polyangiaceae bacterium]|jgi:arginyl-tRNA synthetase|nr:arginine--tRNA ligase [Polyangiaceae bacterium]MBK8938585.1 arginine--tRNA ligase [Polyangiaceae bacterium]